MFNERVRRELYQQRVLVLDGPLDDDNGTLLATQLITLAKEDASSDIALWIHSPGGSVPSMLAIRDVMRLVPCDVSTVVLGIAYSAGQFLLSSGTRGKRRALPHARVLMHQGSAGIAGRRRRHRTAGQRPAAHPRHRPRPHRRGHRPTLDRVFEDSLHDRWYTAQEALEYGFIDSVVGTLDDVVPVVHRTVGLGVPAEGGVR